MEQDQLKQRIDKIEESADQAKAAVQAGQVPQELKDAVMQLHQQARQAKQQMQGQSGGGQQQGDSTNLVNQLEQAADDALKACRNAGNVDQKTQQAVQQAHSEASSLKKQMQMG